MGVNKVVYGDATVMDISDTTATASDMAEGVTAYGADGEKMTGAMVTTKSYDALEDKPSINGVELSGDKSAEDYGIRGVTKFGKSVWIGDSIGQGYNNSDYSYIDIAEESGLFDSVTKYSVGGATLGPYNTADIADGYSGYEQVISHQTDVANADKVFLQFCANDLQSIMAGAISAGTSSDGDTTNSICGYVKKIINKIYELNPLVQIYYLNLCNTHRTISMVADAYSSYFTQNNWGTFDKPGMMSAWIDWQTNVIPTIQEYGIQVINILEDIGLNDVTMPLITTDDYIHPNNDGHKRIFDGIMARVDTETKSSVMYGENTNAGTSLQLVQLTNVSQDMTSATSSKSSQEIYQDYLNGIITAVQLPALGNIVLMTSYTSSSISSIFLNYSNRVHYSMMAIIGTVVTLTNIEEGTVDSWSLDKNWAGQIESGKIVLANGKTINASINKL